MAACRGGCRQLCDVMPASALFAAVKIPWLQLFMVIAILIWTLTVRGGLGTRLMPVNLQGVACIFCETFGDLGFERPELQDHIDRRKGRTYSTIYIR